MSAEFDRLLDRFPGLRCLVIGDAMLDSYAEGPANRLSPEAPVPVVDIAQTTHCPGGAANVAANLAALGASVTLLSVLGADEAGDTLIELLQAHGVEQTRLYEMPIVRLCGSCA